MTLDADPYRTLGVPRGASLDQVKAAYRRLAKANHPDAGGPSALPRFLAIQAAWEQISEGSSGSTTPGRAARPAERTARPTGRTPEGPRAGAGARSASGAPSGSNPRRRPPGTPAPGTGTGSPGTDGRGTGSPGPGSGDPAPGASASGPPPGGSSGSAGSRAERKARGKATLGSTSYDGADASQFEPDWGGASWYGTSSGTYWTINPKEYADPRKHGPEYQARARRRTARGSASDRAAAADPATEPAPDAPTEPAHSTNGWWEARPAPPEAAPRAAAPVQRPSPQADPGAIPDPARAIETFGRSVLDPAHGGRREWVIRSIVGWLPLAFGLGWLVGELTGCGRFAATCGPAVAPLTGIGQGSVLIALLLLPEVAAVTAGAALALLAAAIASSLVLSATGAAVDPASSQAALGAVLLVAWISGIAVALAIRLRQRRRDRFAPDAGPTPDARGSSGRGPRSRPPGPVS